jgi:DNA-directed RNA polymerase subunit RPC12/RpoP
MYRSLPQAPLTHAMTCPTISPAGLRIARENREGFCNWCGKLGIENVDSTARAEQCPNCASRSLYGIDEAVRAGYLQISAAGGREGESQPMLF